MMLYIAEAVLPSWQSPLLEPAEPTRQLPFSAHTAPKHYYEEQENN